MKKILLLKLCVFLITILFIDDTMVKAQATAFTDVTTGSGLENVPLKARNFIQWVDYNNDGYLDLFIDGDTVINAEPGAGTAGKIFRVYKNNAGNGTFTEVTSTVIPNINALTAANISFADYDKDGYLDFIMIGCDRKGGSLSTTLYRNSGPPDYSYSKANAATFTNIQNGVVVWGDYDHDGYADLLISGNTGTGYIRENTGAASSLLYRNNGDGTFTLAKTFSSGAFGSGQCASFVDIDGDGYLDVSLYSYSNVRKFYINNKKGDFTDNTVTGFATAIAGAGSHIWGDFTNDGKNEVLLAAGEGSQAVRYALFGGATSTSVTKIGTDYRVLGPTWSNILNSLKIADYNNDGLTDICLNKGGVRKDNNNNYVQGHDSVLLYKNVYTSGITSAPFVLDYTFPGIFLKNGYSYGQTFGDFNNDGKIDLIVPSITADATPLGKVFLFKNDISVENTKPGQPGNLNATVDGSTVTLTWDATTDDHTPSAGLSYEIRLGSTSSGADIIAPISNPATGYNRLPQAGNINDVVRQSGYIIKGLAKGAYKWSVHAIDGSFTGGDWAAEGTITISSEQAKNVMVSNLTSTDVSLSWTNGSEANRIVLMKQGADAFPVLPDSAFIANSVFKTAGSNYRSTGWYCVYDGAGSTINITGLTANSVYSVAVLEYSGSGASIKYNLSKSSGNPIRFSTYAVPTTQATTVTFTGITSSQFNVNWVNGDGTSRAVFIYKGTVGTNPAPVNCTSYFANTAYGIGSQIGSSGWYCIYNGTGSSVTVTGLFEKTNYNVMVCEYNGTSGGEIYLTTTATGNPALAQSISSITTQASAIQVVAGNTKFDITWTNGTGAMRAMFMTLGNAGSPTISDNQTYTANTIFGQGTADGNGWYCVYNGTGSSVSVTGLLSNTEYRIVIYEYNGNAGSEKYLTADAPIGNPSNQKTDSRLQQNITIGILADKTYGEPSFYLSAKGGESGNPIKFSSSDVNVATITDSTVTIVGAGTVNITANQDGNSIYADAAPQVRTLVVNKATQKISFAPLAAKTYGDAPYDLVATGGDTGNPVTFASDNASVTTISGSTVTIVGAGTAKITASQAGNTNYLAAKDSIQTLTVNKAAQTVSFTLPTKTYFDAPFTISATASSGLPVTYSAANANIVTVSHDTVTIVQPGSVAITASQTGNSNYLAANSTKTLTVNKASQTITFDPITGPFKNTDADYQLGATASSGLRITYTCSDLSIAAIQGNTTNDFIHFFGGGTAIITAFQVGNNYYAAATPVTQTITVTSATDIPQLTDGEAMVYPNPASNNITISLGSSLMNATIGVYSLTGQQMSMVKVDNSVVDINVSDLKPGIYLVKIINASSVIVKQIVKQ